MANIQNVSFQSPGFDYSADIYALQRRQALAEALRAQSMQPIEQQQAGGLPVPISPFQGLNKIAQGVTSGIAEKKVEEGQRQLAERSRSDLAGVLQRGSQLAATDPMGAANIYLSHPTTAPLGMSAAQQAMADARRRSIIAELRKQQDGGNPMVPGTNASVMAGAPGTSPAQGAPAASAIPGIPDAMLPLYLSGDQALEKLAGASMEAGKPVNMRPGGTLATPQGVPIFTAPQGGITTQWGPNGPVAGLVPNAQELTARQAGLTAGAQEAGRAPFQLETVQTPGAPTLMTRQQAIEGATGRPMQSPFAIPGGQVQPGSAPIARGRPGLQLQDQGQGRAQVEMGEGLGKRFNAIQDSGFNASQKINKFSRLGTLLEDINTGKLAPTGFEIAAYAKSLGIPISEKLDNAQAAKAVANDLALELRNPSGGAGMPGALSDADRNFLLSMVANLDKTPGANKLLIEGSIKLAQRDREVADLARQYKKKHGQFDEGFYDELQKFSDSRPLFTKAKPSGSVVDFNQLK